jgi:hypothetical protein
MPSGISNEAVAYRDNLPPGCPPKEATEIAGETVCYRLVQNTPPNEEDFRSQRALLPNQDFRLSECQVRGLSVFMKPADADRAAQRSRNLQGTKVAKVTLGQGAGCIQKTGTKKSSHHTWWPYKAFDILANCEVMQ